MIEEIRELIQTLLVPQLEAIRGEVAEVRGEVAEVRGEVEGVRGEVRGLAADIRTVDVKVESYRRELLAEIRRVEEVLSTDFVRLEEKVDIRLAAMNEKLDLQRRELLAEIRAALK